MTYARLDHFDGALRSYEQARLTAGGKALQQSYEDSRKQNPSTTREKQ